MNQAVPKIDPEKCTGCGKCVEQCPAQAVGMWEGKAAIVKPFECRYCTSCESVCPYDAIRYPFEILLAEKNFAG